MTKIGVKIVKMLEIYRVVSGLEKKTNERKVPIFLNCAREEALDIFNTLNLSEKKKTIQKVVEAFDGYCKPMLNKIYNSYIIGHKQ